MDQHTKQIIDEHTNKSKQLDLKFDDPKIQQLYDTCICCWDKECGDIEFIKRVGLDKERFESITTFDGLCEYMSKYVNNEYKYQPGCGSCSKQKSCWEEEDNIIDYLIQLNKNKFLTQFSQPSNNDHINGDRYYLQRASVSGYVKNGIGMEIFNKLKDDNRFYIELKSFEPLERTMETAKELKRYYTNGEYDYYKVVILSNIHKSNADDCYCISMDGGVELTFSNFDSDGFHDGEIKPIIINKVCYNSIKNINIENKHDLSYLHICDKEWGNSDQYLWKTLLDILKVDTLHQ